MICSEQWQSTIKLRGATQFLNSVQLIAIE